MSEGKAAIELDTHWGHSPNHVIIHDLRIELDGLVAQIDHLLINRLQPRALQMLYGSRLVKPNGSVPF